MSKDFCEKVSKSLTGRILSDEHRQNISKGMRGSKHPWVSIALKGKKRDPSIGEKVGKKLRGRKYPEAGIKISQKLFGRKLSICTKQKISTSTKGTILVSNGIKTIRVLPNQIPNGYSKIL